MTGTRKANIRVCCRGILRATGLPFWWDLLRRLQSVPCEVSTSVQKHRRLGHLSSVSHPTWVEVAPEGDAPESGEGPGTGVETRGAT